MTVYECEFCPRSFATQAGLDNHLADLHADAEGTSAVNPEAKD